MDKNDLNFEITLINPREISGGINRCETYLKNRYCRKTIYEQVRCGICGITDFAIMEGGKSYDCLVPSPNDNNRNLMFICEYLLISYNHEDSIYIASFDSFEDGKQKIWIPKTAYCKSKYGHELGLRPVINYTNLSDIIKEWKYDETFNRIGSFGEYPQNIASHRERTELENQLYYNGCKEYNEDVPYDNDSNDLILTGKSYCNGKYPEYMFRGQKYIRIAANTCSPYYTSKTTYTELIPQPEVITREYYNEPGWTDYFVTGVTFKRVTKESGYGGAHYGDDVGEHYWVRVQPIWWYIDETTKKLFSVVALNNAKNYNQQYLNNDFKKEIVPSKVKILKR